MNYSSGQRNFEARSEDESLDIPCTQFEEKTVRLYLDFVHNIKQGNDEIEFNQLLDLIRFLNDMGKTGYYSLMLVSKSIIDTVSIWYWHFWCLC